MVRRGLFIYDFRHHDCLERVPGKVLAEAKEQEHQEEFIASRVALGEPLDGLFPLSDARRPDYEAWLAQQPPTPRPPQTRHDVPSSRL